MRRTLAFLACIAVLSASAVWAQSVDTAITNLFEPYDVAVDANNVYYVTDSSNNRILQFSPDTGARTNLAGVVGTAGRGYVDGPGYQARFSNPQGLTLARGGFVVADSGNHLIRFVTPDGVVSTLAGSAGAADYVDGTNAIARFKAPTGLDADAAGNIYIADLLNNAIRKLTTSNTVVTVATGFVHPSAVAVGPDGVLFVADSGNHSIKLVDTNGTVTLLAGSGSSFVSGLKDDLIGTQARFNNPLGLLWVGGNTGLLVSDTGNRVVRRVFFNTTVTNYTVETLASTVGAFLTPVGLAQDANGDTLVVDLGGNAVRRIVATQTQKPVSDPSIGVVNITVDPQSGQPAAFLTPVTSSTFNNDVVVAILAENGTETFYTIDGSEPSGSNGSSPPPFKNGQSSAPTSILNQNQQNAPNDVTIKAVGTAGGRRSSAVVTARFQFQVANPAIIGNNPGAVAMESATTNAVIYYTTDGSDPTTGSALYAFGTRISIVNGTNDVTLKVRAFKNGYASSRVVSQAFSFQNLQTSSIGITRDFSAGVGSRLVVPVEVKLNTNDVLRSLQFRVEVTPNGGAPLVSDQLAVLPISTNIDFIRVPPPSTNMPYWVVYTNTAASGLVVAYLGNPLVGTNIVLNAAGDFLVAGEGTVAMLSVPIPPTAVEGQTYNIGVFYPSGTSDGIETPVVLKSLDTRTITVKNIPYVVGDTALSSWYNAGDFGNGNLNNNDVNNAFYAAIGVRVPYSFSDLHNAMDVYPLDTTSGPGGDGSIRYLDWQVILDRAVRRDTNNWTRSWSATGQRIVVSTNLNSAPSQPGQQVTPSAADGRVWTREAKLVGQALGDVRPGDLVRMSVVLNIQPGHDVAGLQFLATALPDGGAPALATPLRFTPAQDVPTPSHAVTFLPGSVGCGWALGGFRPSLTGSRLLGHLEFTVPAAAKSGQKYLVRFISVDGSALKAGGQWADYNLESVGGSVWVLSPVLSPPDAISDEWRQHFFGNLTSAFASAFADPDGDGRSNLEEFLAGTDPAKLRFQALFDQWRANTPTFKLEWFAKPGKKYIVEYAASPTGPWQPVSELVLGGFAEGRPLQLDAPRLDLKSLFYRVRELN